MIPKGGRTSTGWSRAAERNRAHDGRVEVGWLSAPEGSGAYQRIYAVVRRIPRGRVCTYGEVARAAGASGPRQAGYALHALPASSDVPWHRVINARGEISLPPAAASEQRARLAAEGVLAGPRGRIDLARYGWVGRIR